MAAKHCGPSWRLRSRHCAPFYGHAGVHALLWVPLPVLKGDRLFFYRTLPTADENPLAPVAREDRQKNRLDNRWQFHMSTGVKTIPSPSIQKSDFPVWTHVHGAPAAWNRTLVRGCFMILLRNYLQSDPATSVTIGKAGLPADTGVFRAPRWLIPNAVRQKPYDDHLAERAVFLLCLAAEKNIWLISVQSRPQSASGTDKFSRTSHFICRIRLYFSRLIAFASLSLRSAQREGGSDISSFISHHSSFATGVSPCAVCRGA